MQNMMNQPGFQQMMQQFMQGGGMGGGFPFPGGAGFGAPPPPAASPAAPAAPSLSQAELKQKYASEIQQLKDMGFCNEDTNATVLQQTNGNVEAAVERLLSMLGGG